MVEEERNRRGLGRLGAVQHDSEDVKRHHPGSSSGFSGHSAATSSQNRPRTSPSPPSSAERARDRSAAPVENDNLKTKVKDDMLKTSLADDVTRVPRVKDEMGDKVDVSRTDSEARAARAQANGGMGYLESFTYYWNDLWRCHTDCCGLLKIWRGHHDWKKAFGKWNLIWCQLMLFLLPIYLILIVIQEIQNIRNFVLRVFFVGLRTQIVIRVVGLIMSHMAYFLLVELGGCCRSTGPVLWMFIYLSMTSSFLFDHNTFFGIVRGTWQTTYLVLHLPMLFPMLYVMLTLWKLGASRVFEQCTRACWKRTAEQLEPSKEDKAQQLAAIEQSERERDDRDVRKDLV